MEQRLNISLKYFVATILMLIFTLNDLVFDFLFDFESSDYISFIFTVMAAMITFICTYKIVKTNIAQKQDAMSKFIRSNFDRWQVLFSCLDIICGLISILSGVMVIGGLFKAVKIVYIPIRFITLTNKGKSIVKAVTKGSLIWTAGRSLTKEYNGGEKVMKKIKEFFTWIFANKKTLVGIGSTAVATLSGSGVIDISSIPALQVGAVNITPIIYYVLLAVLSIVGVSGKGFETIKAFFERVTEEKAEKEEAQLEKEAKKEIAAEEKEANQTQAEAEKAAAKAEAKAKADEEKAQAEAERKAKIEAIKAKLKAEAAETTTEAK